MTGCKDAMRLDLDLGEDVSRDDLKSCLDSGWSADEIAEELDLDGAADVRRWCLYHDLPAPRVVAGAADTTDTTQPIKIMPKEAAAGGKSEVRGAVRGVVTKTSGALERLTTAQVKAAYLEHGSYDGVARSLGITTYHVKRLLTGEVVVSRDEARKATQTLRQSRDNRKAHRRALLLIAVRALKEAGASWQEVRELLVGGNSDAVRDVYLMSPRTRTKGRESAKKETT